MKRLFVTAMLTVGLSTPAFAGHCPKDVKLIDEAMAKAEGLSSAQMSEIKQLRDKGEILHKSGSHGESLDALHKALKMLGVESH